MISRRQLYALPPDLGVQGLKTLGASAFPDNGKWYTDSVIAAKIAHDAYVERLAARPPKPLSRSN